jgi:hypothetical protein
VEVKEEVEDSHEEAGMAGEAGEAGEAAEAGDAGEERQPEQHAHTPATGNDGPVEVNVGPAAPEQRRLPPGRYAVGDEDTAADDEEEEEKKEGEDGVDAVQRRNRTPQFKGAFLDKRSGKWQAVCNGKGLGCQATKEAGAYTRPLISST